VKPFWKYLLFQVPQWLVIGFILWVLVRWSAIPPWAAGVALAAWVLKDLATFPLVRRAYESDARTGAETLIGARAIAQDTLDPEGYIKVNGELWKGRADPTGETIAAGTVVQVRAAQGMTLIVSARSPESGRRGAPR
jgi:membrane protein implicated in regulation of membrane protease activity